MGRGEGHGDLNEISKISRFKEIGLFGTAGPDKHGGKSELVRTSESLQQTPHFST